MNSSEYIKELEKELLDLSYEERKNAIDYYKEYFQDVPKEDEEEDIKRLGNPKELAENIKKEKSIFKNSSDDTIDESKNLNQKSKKNKAHNIALIVLLILTSIIWLPILISILIILLSVLLCVVVVILCIPICGIAALASSFYIMMYQPFSALFNLGVGIFLIGITIIGFIPLCKGIKSLILLIGSGVKKIYKKIF